MYIAPVDRNCYHKKNNYEVADMKTLYLIGRTMGAGKTTVCQHLKRLLPQAVFLDGDWCWDADPFQVTEETKAMVMDNICHLVNNFLHCSAYENVIFCWVMHQQSILDDILSRLDTENCSVRTISLICDETALRERLQKDVDAGLRRADVIERSVLRISMYEKLNTEKLNVSNISAQEAAAQIAGC